MRRELPEGRPRRRARLGSIAGLAALAIAAAFGALSPWPSVWFLRARPDPGALGGAAAAKRYAPAGVERLFDVRYDPASPQGRLDVFAPAEAAGALPVVFWTHGGGFIAGEKEPLRDYLAILASHGFTVVNVEYTHAPEAIYPTPIEQLNAAIAFVLTEARRYHADPRRVVLAGDSAGAHIAAQAAMAIAQPAYAAAAGLPAAIAPDRLVGAVLFSGAYDPTSVRHGDPALGFFTRTVMWAYSGRRDFLHDGRFLYCNLPAHVTGRYPPAFVSTGPGDALLAQNLEWVAALRRAGAPPRTLFFDPAKTGPAIGHEYQLALDMPEAKRAMVEMVAFLREVTRAEYRAGVADGWPPGERGGDAPRSLRRAAGS